MSEKSPHDINKLARVFVKIRDARAAATREYDKQDEIYKQNLETLSVAMLECLGKTQGVKTSDGLSVFKQKDIKPQVRDWDLLYAWIKETDNFEVLERRVKKTFVAEYREEHKDDEESNPPGVSVIEEYKVIVRKGS